MEKIGVEGATLKSAIQAACSQLEVSERDLRYKLDADHFRDEFGKVRGVDTVRILAWAEERTEAPAEEKAESKGDDGASSEPPPRKRGRSKRRSDRPERSERNDREKSDAGEAPTEDPNATEDKLNYVERFVTGTLDHLGLNGLKVSVEAGEDGDRSTVSIKGLDELEVDKSILKRIFTSLEYLSNRLSPPQGGRGPRIAFDLGQPSGDNEKERALQAVAAKVVDQVLARGKSLTLKPMNSYERRIIHLAVADFDGVSSKSIGDGSRKRVRVFPLDDEGDDD